MLLGPLGQSLVILIGVPRQTLGQYHCGNAGVLRRPLDRLHDWFNGVWKGLLGPAECGSQTVSPTPPALWVPETPLGPCTTGVLRRPLDLVSGGFPIVL